MGEIFVFKQLDEMDDGVLIINALGLTTIDWITSHPKWKKS